MLWVLAMVYCYLLGWSLAYGGYFSSEGFHHTFPGVAV